MHPDDEPIFDKDRRQIGSGYTIESFGVSTGDEVFNESGSRVGWAFYGSVHISNPNERSISDSNDLPSGCSTIFDIVSGILGFIWYAFVALFVLGIIVCPVLRACGDIISNNLSPQSYSVPSFPQQVLSNPSPSRSPSRNWTAVNSTSSSVASTNNTPQTRGGIVNVDSLRLRNGPGVTYDIFKSLKKGTVVEILGRTSDGSWLNVFVPSISTMGWVSTQYIKTNVSINAVPTALNIPKSVSTSRPKDTATPVSQPDNATTVFRPNTGTPPVPDGIELAFSADQEIIKQGQCTIIRWGIGNVQAIYLDGQGLGGGYAEKQVCPNSTTTYTMRIVLRDGNVIERSIVVRVQ